MLFVFILFVCLKEPMHVFNTNNINYFDAFDLALAPSLLRHSIFKCYRTIISIIKHLITKSHSMYCTGHLHLARTKVLRKLKKKRKKPKLKLGRTISYTSRAHVCCVCTRFKLAIRYLQCMDQGHCKNPHEKDAHSTNYCIMDNLM